MRRYNIDYLMLFGIFLLFPFHAFRLFDPYEAFYIESAVKSLGGVKFMSFLWPWFMPLMFLVAGISTWYALQKRTGKQYIKERVFRLLIPFMLGVILIVPIQGYMARLQRGTLNGSYFNYLFTQFFSDFSDLSGIRARLHPRIYGLSCSYLFSRSSLKGSLYMCEILSTAEGKTVSQGYFRKAGFYYYCLSR